LRFPRFHAFLLFLVPPFFPFQFTKEAAALDDDLSFFPQLVFILLFLQALSFFFDFFRFLSFL